MKHKGRKFVFIFLAIFFFIMATSHLLWAASEAEKNQENTQPDVSATAKDTSESRLNRIDFGNTYIIGQTIKSGAVYLLQRKKSEIKSMLTYRQDYRKEILEGFLVEPVDVPAKDQKQVVTSKSGRRGSDRLVSQDE
jgi:hypothetical protein